MQTKVCKIYNTMTNYREAMDEVEAMATKNGMQHKQMIQLKLLAEETLGIPKGILGFQEGKFFVENEGANYTIHFESALHIGEDAKQKFLTVANDGKNSRYKGFKGKLQMIAEHMISDSMASKSPNAYERAWYYQVYESDKKDKNKKEEWDEYEKSILKSFADDVVIKISKDDLIILVIKKF